MLLVAFACATTVSAQSTTPEGWNLRWRKSPQVTPKPVHVPREDVFAHPAARANAPVTRSSTAPAPHDVSQHVGQVAHQQRAGASQNAFRNATAPRQMLRQATAGSYVQQVGHQTPVESSGSVQQVANANPNDFFNNPFGDARIPSTIRSAPGAVRFAQGTAPAQRPGLPPSDPAPNVVPAAPQTSQSILIPETLPPTTPQEALGNAPEMPDLQNGLRGAEPQAELPAPRTPSAPQPNPSDSEFRDLLQQGGDQLGEKAPGPPSEPMTDEAQEAESPSDREADEPEPYKNPFNQSRDGAPSNDEGDDANPDLPSRNVIAPNEISCEEFRSRIARDTIDQLTLDISPPFRPDVFDPEEYEKQRERFDRKQQTRDWTDIQGSRIATGRLVDLAYEKVVIENQTGARQQLSIHKMGEADLAYISENWGLPKECLVEQVAYTPRAWTAMTMTWKASNICSKQRYYEQVNLERYGHTAGPVLQPIVSSAHFFANIAITPYKMGIHPPNECHYALGYYRPGNCAPWIVPPFPISPRGALAQGAFVSGLYWLIP